MEEPLSRLSPRERRVLDVMSGAGSGGRKLSVDEVARRFGVSPGRILHILARAKKKLT
jgi:DNA-directed RNA polymerase sigma subunit (sigma70/sigma32)